MSTFVFGACPAVMVGDLELAANWRGLGVGWSLAFVCALLLSTAMFAMGLAVCRRGCYMGRKRCAFAVAMCYSLVMHILLCFFMLFFAAWFSHY